MSNIKIEECTLGLLKQQIDNISKLIFSNIGDSCQNKIYYQPITTTAYMSNIDIPILKSDFGICLLEKNKKNFKQYITCTMESKLLDREANKGITSIEFQFADCTKDPVNIVDSKFNSFLELWAEEKVRIIKKLSPYITNSYKLLNEIAPKSNVTIRIKPKKTLQVHINKGKKKKVKFIMCD